jgi:hypothetical protein
MNIKKIKLQDNNLQLTEPIKPSITKKIEYVLSDDYLLSIKQTFVPSRVVSITPTTVDHNITLEEPQHITAIENKETASTIPSYYVQPTFNYLSLDWESRLGSLGELQSPVIYTQEEGRLQDKSFNTNAINRQFAKNANSLSRLFMRRNRIEVEKHKNILFGTKYEYKTMNHYKKNYPFYNEISFSNKTRQEFKTRLKDLGLYELFLEDYIQASKDFTSFGERSLPTFDFNQWIHNSDFEIDETNIKILQPSYTKPNNFFYNLKKLNLIGFTRQMLRAYQRRVFGILNKVDCYNEVMFYRFDKYDNRSNRLIQSFWLPAEESVNFIDTQVKYGTIYRYSCTAHVLIIGASYSITKNKDFLESIVNPSLKIVEIPMFEDTCNIIQPPQPIPDIDFQNNKHNKNELNILIKLNANYYNDNFIPLEETELSQNSLVSEYNKLNRRPYFHYETEHALFEIFRLDHMPKTYDEIDNFKIGEVRHPVPSTSTAIKDKISIGKKYYYVFRSINSHGLLSNPTPIYQIELLKMLTRLF